MAANNVTLKWDDITRQSKRYLVGDSANWFTQIQGVATTPDWITTVPVSSPQIGYENSDPKRHNGSSAVVFFDNHAAVLTPDAALESLAQK